MKKLLTLLLIFSLSSYAFAAINKTKPVVPEPKLSVDRNIKAPLTKQDKVRYIIVLLENMLSLSQRGLLPAQTTGDEADIVDGIKRLQPDDISYMIDYLKKIQPLINEDETWEQNQDRLRFRIFDFSGE